MKNSEFSFPSFFHSAFEYFRALLKKQILQFGNWTNKSIKSAVVIGTILIVAPIILFLLFVALAFGYHEWLHIGYASSFLLSAFSAFIIGVLSIYIGYISTRKLRAKILSYIMEQVKHLDNTSRSTCDLTETIEETKSQTSSNA